MPELVLPPKTRLLVIFPQQFPACGFRLENDACFDLPFRKLIAHNAFLNSLSYHLGRWSGSPWHLLPVKHGRISPPTPSSDRLRSHFGSLPDPRSGEVEIPLGDALMSAFAMFSLKDPSLLAFDHRRRDPNDNFRTIYGINHVPSDSQMRAILDPVDPTDLRAPFREIFRRLQRGKVLERFVYLDGHYLLSLDGTTYFSSSKIHCPSCLVKHHRNGSVTYSHQLLGATLVHPDLKEVIPLAPEPIIQQDGQTKNDCERNATRRWLKRFRQEHPHLPVIVVEDALSANAPHLRDLREAGAHYIIGVKPGDHAFLFAHLQTLDEAGQMQVLTLVDPATGILHHFRFCNGAPLNESNPDELVNVLEYWEIHPDGKVQHFSWITDFLLTPDDRLGHHAGGTSPLEDRERDLQHPEKPRLSPGAQLRTRRAEPVGGAGPVDDVGLPGGSSSATVLSLVPGGLEQDEDQVPPLGRDPQPFSHACALTPWRSC